MARGKTTAAATGRSIEQTLTALNMDKGMPADVTAQMEAAAAAEELDNAPDDGEGAGDIPALEPKDGLRIGGDAEDDDEGEGEGGGGLGNIGGDDDDDMDAVPFPNDTPPRIPITPALVPSPASSGGRGRGKARERPQVRGLAKSLADKVPGSDKVKVYKRIDGRRWFIQDFTKSDLNQFPDFESFLTRYVKPQHGAGEYDLVGVDGLNRESELGQVRLIEAQRESTGGGAFALVEKVLTESRENNERWLQKMASGQSDPLTLLNGVMALKEKLDNENGGGMATAMKAMSEANSSNMQLMLAMMQQSQQTMMALLSKPKEEDPVMKLLLAKLLQDNGALGGGAAMPPPPPPPPNPTSGLSEVLTAMAAFMGAMNNGGGEDEFKEFLKQKELSRANETLGIKDILALVTQQNNNASGPNTLKETIDNLAAVMNIAQNINRQQEPGAAAGFFDAVAALFSNRDFAGSIAQTIRSKTDTRTGEAEARLRAEAQRLQMEQRLLQQERARLAATPQPQPPQQPPVVQETAPRMPAQPPVTQAPAFTPTATAEEQQAAAQRTIQRTGRIPELPNNTYEHINNILTAKDDAERVGKVVGMLIYFAEFDDWKPFTERLLTLVRDGKQEESMKYLGALFEGLAAIGMFPNELVPQAVALLNEHFDVVQDQLAELNTDADREITAEMLAGEAEEVEPAAE